MHDLEPFFSEYRKDHAVCHRSAVSRAAKNKPGMGLDQRLVAVRAVGIGTIDVYALNR